MLMSLLPLETNQWHSTEYVRGVMKWFGRPSTLCTLGDKTSPPERCAYHAGVLNYTHQATWVLC